jgi:threonine synthase
MGKQNNNNNGVNVNTRLYTSYSDTCMLSLGAWNDKLSIKFHPMKGTNADGIRQYASDNSEIVNTSLTVENTGALLDGIEKTVNPAINDKQSASVSITMGINENRKVITVSTDGTDVFITAYVGVSNDGKADPTNSVTHKFNKKEYMVGYDPATGSGETVAANSDFENFVKKLKDIYVISAATAHSIKYSDAVRNSLGSRNFNNNNGGSQNDYSAPVNNFTGDDMSQFLPMS